MKALIVGLPIVQDFRLSPCPLSAVSFLPTLRSVGGEGVESFKEVGGSCAAPHLFEFPPLPRCASFWCQAISLRGRGRGGGEESHQTHGGRAVVEARPGGASTFWFTLPSQGSLP